jgi:hypothetical protein
MPSANLLIVVFTVIGIPMQAVLGSWFLYSILDWSALVGLGGS